MGTQGTVNRLTMFGQWLKHKRCDHTWCLVWKHDYDEHVLGEKPSPFRNLRGEATVRVCNKCGAVEEGPFVSSEEIAWTDANMISHFE